MTTPKSNPSKHYKHFRKTIAFCLDDTAVSGRGHFVSGSFRARTFVPDSGFGTYAMLTAMVILP
jgi:hypothetical protein